MLYVFHVDAGQMLTYDMNLTLQTVASLKNAIEKKTKILASSLVLLVSGGDVLQSENMVSKYSAGTDTNPIYMFIRPSVKESHLKQSMCGDLSPIVELSTGPDVRGDGKSVAELNSAVEMCCSMPPTVHTVISCATLAQQFSDLAHEVSRNCDQLVHDQHLQHQGWAAVVANLEDIFNEFCERSKCFKESFKKHRLKKEEYTEQLNTLNEVLESLGKIPILPALQLNAEAHRFSAFDVFEENDFYCKISQRLDSSSEKKSGQDFGVEAFKLSEEDVFAHKEATASTSKYEPSDPRPIEESDEGVTFKAQSYESKEELTLLHWILAQGNKASLQDIIDYCQKGLAMLDAEPLKEREAELYHILEYANMHGLKQIKGIEDRLYGLDQLLSEVKKLERDQHDQAASLIQYRDRLNTACDPSVLPTLVQSHWCQLEKLLKGHQVLIDIRRRIARSKDELSHILKARLEAVLVIENSMSVQDAHAMLSYQCFSRLARYFSIVEQLHKAPAVFARAVVETARRRAFSQAHLKWATDLASKLLKIHEEEVAKRQEFNFIFEGHFLKSLFPGMTELPPTFATQAPPVFDDRLPKLTEEDIEYIRTTFPQISEDVPSYDMETTVRFFQQRLSSSDLIVHKEVDVQVDDKDLGSETDFERLSGQISTNTRQRTDTSTTCAPDTMAVSTVTEVRNLAVMKEIDVNKEEFESCEFYIEESLPSSLEWGREDIQDNMDTHKINIEKLNEFIVKLGNLCRSHIQFVREELKRLTQDVEDQKCFIKGKYVEILEEWKKCNEENAIKFREQTQRLTVDHELEMSDIKAALNAKDEDIKTLKTDKENLKITHQKDLERVENEHKNTKDLLEKIRDEIKTYEKKIEDIEANKQGEIKMLQEKMHMDYKAEIESLRSRFRLVALTNMDRSPSESSLEKIERTDVIEINSHNAIVMQTKENAEVEKEEAVRKALEKCECEWRDKLNEELAALKAKYEVEKQDTLVSEVTRRLLSEKDKQMELFREREQALARECAKYRDTIQQLTDPQTNDIDSLMKTQLATLENENAILQQQVKDLKKEIEKKAEDGDKSRESDSDGRSPPRRSEPRRPRSKCHTPLGLGGGTLSLSSCLPGHTVLILWDPAHLNYTVMQEASIMYFVHSDCLPALELSIQLRNEAQRKLYAIAVVESKEYCYAKKSGNRYNMPRGSRFYRVRARPLLPAPPPPPCCEHASKQDVMKSGVLSALENRPVKKWLTYMHAPDMQKSVDTSQSTSSATDDAGKVSEVVTATLINLESPASTSEGISGAVAGVGAEAESGAGAEAGAGMDQLDSIEAGEIWHNAKANLNTTSVVSDMECSVGQCLEPSAEPPELAEEAEP